MVCGDHLQSGGPIVDSLMHELAELLPSDEASKRIVRNALDAIEAGEKCALIFGYDPQSGISIHEFDALRVRKSPGDPPR